MSSEFVVLRIGQIKKIFIFVVLGLEILSRISSTDRSEGLYYLSYVWFIIFTSIFQSTILHTISSDNYKFVIGHVGN